MLEALATGMFSFHFIATELAPTLIEKTAGYSSFTLLIQQAAMQKAGIALSCDLLKQNSQIISIGIIADTKDLTPLLVSDWCYKLNGIVDMSFGTNQLLSCIQRIVMNKHAFECFSERHPEFGSKINGFLANKPKLNHLELEELRALHRFESMSKYTKERGIARSTGYRKFERLAHKEDVPSIDALRFKACAKRWI